MSYYRQFSEVLDWWAPRVRNLEKLRLIQDCWLVDREEFPEASLQ